MTVRSVKVTVMPWYVYGYLEADIIIGLQEVLRGDAGRELVALPAQVSVLKGEGAPRELVCWQGDAMGIGGQPPAEVYICSLHGTLLHHHVHIYLGLILLVGLGHDLHMYHQASSIGCYCHDYCFFLLHHLYFIYSIIRVVIDVREHMVKHPAFLVNDQTALCGSCQTTTSTRFFWM